MFYDNGTAPMVSNSTLTALLQRYITRFVDIGSSNEPGLPPFAMNDDPVAQKFDSPYIEPVQDEPLSGEKMYVLITGIGE